MLTFVPAVAVWILVARTLLTICIGGKVCSLRVKGVLLEGTLKVGTMSEDTAQS